MDSKVESLGKNPMAMKCETNDNHLVPLKELVGGNVVICITGANKINPETSKYLAASMSCMFSESLAMTETPNGLTATSPNHPFDGCVGVPEHYKIKLKDVPEKGYLTTDKPNPRGELLVKSHCLIKGYFKRPDLTKAAIDEDGWFATGDVVEITPDGRIRVIDRANNLFKINGRLYVAVEYLESLYSRSKYVKQLLVYVTNSVQYLTAIVVLDDKFTHILL